MELTQGDYQSVLKINVVTANQEDWVSIGGSLASRSMRAGRPQASMRTVVLIRGTLRGMGRESKCEMVAMRDTAADGPHAVYSLCSVITAAPDLPDGEYVVEFDGRMVRAKREVGLWLPEEFGLKRAA